MPEIETKKEYDPNKRHEYYEKQKARKQNLENSLLGIAGLTLDKLLELMKEFYRTANSNPAVGVATSLITVDILFRLKIIDKETAIAVMVMLGTLDGAQIAGSIIEDFTNITHFFSKSPNNMDLKPSATTIVYAEGGNESSLMKALLTREGVKG